MGKIYQIAIDGPMDLNIMMFKSLKKKFILGRQPLQNGRKHLLN